MKQWRLWALRAVGSRILAELSAAGNNVTAIARHPENIPTLPGVWAVAGDANDKNRSGRPAARARCGGQRRAVSDPISSLLTPCARRASNGTSGRRRGQPGGGSGPDSAGPAGLSAAYKPEAAAGAAFLNLLRRTDGLWTGPSFHPRPCLNRANARKIPLGHGPAADYPQGSSISFEDYAIAFVDELEKPRHVRQRFTVGY